MTSYTGPGIYVKEQNFSYYVKQISTSSCAMVGVASKGPINQVGLVSSWDQFIHTYGGYMVGSHLAYAARSFFDNGGNVLFINRVAHLEEPTDRESLTARSAMVRVPDRSGRASMVSGVQGDNQIHWEAATQGTPGNLIEIEMEATSSQTSLAISVLGNRITITLATDESGNPISSVQDIVDLVNQTEAASSLVKAYTLEDGIAAPFGVVQLTGGADPGEALQITAKNEGVWGDDLLIELHPNFQGTFNLLVTYKGNPVESHANVSHFQNAPHFIGNIASDWIKATLLKTPLSLEDAPQYGVYALTGGDDGVIDLNDMDYIGDPSQRTGLYAFEATKINLLAVPGITTAPVIHAGIAYAESRLDFLFLVDPPSLLSPLEVIQFRRGEGIYNHAAFNTTYASMYYPWVEILDPLTGTPRRIPPSGAIAGCMARNDQTDFVWTAPAGIDRGRILNAINVSYEVSPGELDVLYPESINVIMSFPESGLVIWGQKTLTFEPSAVDRVNVRREMLFLESSISQSTRFIVFEPNNPQSWRALIRTIQPFLKDVQDNGGLYDFQVQCDAETNTPVVIDQNRMVARVFVKPVKSAEFIELKFTLTPTGADFKEIYG